MFDTIGDRLTYCRGLLGYTRGEMSFKLEGISSQCLTRWELNYVKIPKYRLLKLVKFFNENSIQLSYEWLISGKGMPPLNLNQKEYLDSGFDEIIYNSAIELMQKIKGFQFKQVNNKFFEPILTYGDYVGGIIIKEKDLIDKKLYFSVNNNEINVGYFLYKDKSIINLHGKIKKINFTNAIIGEVMWIGRRT